MPPKRRGIGVRLGRFRFRTSGQHKRTFTPSPKPRLPHFHGGNAAISARSAIALCAAIVYNQDNGGQKTEHEDFNGRSIRVACGADGLRRRRQPAAG